MERLAGISDVSDGEEPPFPELEFWDSSLELESRLDSAVVARNISDLNKNSTEISRNPRKCDESYQRFAENKQ